MSDRIVDKAWSNVQSGDFVRWATPRFVRYGRVITHPPKSDSLRVEFWQPVEEKAIPNARWYFVQGKMKPDAEEHLVVIDLTPMELLVRAGALTDEDNPPLTVKPRRSHEPWITVQTACEQLKMDQKQLRRHIRRGVVIAEKRDGIWYIDQERLRDAAAKFGWI